MTGTADDLIGKRRELVARRREIKGELTRLAGDITAIDRVLRILDPEYRPEAALRPGRPSRGELPSPFARGEMGPATLDALRSLDRAVTSSECASAMLAKCGILADEKMLAQITNSVSAVLAQKAERGLVARAGNGQGRQVLWKAVRP